MVQVRLAGKFDRQPIEAGCLSQASPAERLSGQCPERQRSGLTAEGGR